MADQMVQPKVTVNGGGEIEILNRRYRLLDESSKAWPCFYPVCIPVHPVHPRQNQTLGASARPSPEVHHHPWLYLAGDEQDGRGCKTDKSKSCLAKPRLSKFELPKLNRRIRAQGLCQGREVPFRCFPKDFMTYPEIFVDYKVAQASPLGPGKLRVGLPHVIGNVVGGFADDPEIPDDGIQGPLVR